MVEQRHLAEEIAAAEPHPLVRQHDLDRARGNEEHAPAALALADDQLVRHQQARPQQPAPTPSARSVRDRRTSRTSRSAPRSATRDRAAAACLTAAAPNARARDRRTARRRSGLPRTGRDSATPAAAAPIAEEAALQRFGVARGIAGAARRARARSPRRAPATTSRELPRHGLAEQRPSRSRDEAGQHLQRQAARQQRLEPDRDLALQRRRRCAACDAGNARRENRG